jgi:tetratricopeptide (TPR) repeat protein
MSRLFVLFVLCALLGCEESEELRKPPDAGGWPDAGEQDAASEQDASGAEDSSVADAAIDATELILPEGNTHRPDGIAHCYTELSSTHDATQAFWVAFTNARFEDREAVTAGLAEAAEDHPDEEEFALLHGLAALWRLAEPTPDEEDDMAGLITAAFTARDELERAYELCPTDHRLPAWLGPILVNTGRATSDQATIDEGLAVLQQGIDHYPSFVLFSKLLIFAQDHKDSDDFQGALDALMENIMVCGDEDPACNNNPRAAHNREGALVFMGDVLAKSGDRAMALETYELALEEPDYGSWDYKELLAERIEKLDDRIASFDNDAPEDDFQSAWSSTYQCSVCHKH